MSATPDTLVILTPAFAGPDDHRWLPAQQAFVRVLNRMHPGLKVILLVFHYPIVQPAHGSWEGNEIMYFNGGMKGKARSVWLWARVWRCLLSLKRQHKLLGLFSFFCSESAFIGHHFARRYGLRHYIWVLGQDALPDNRQVRRIHPAPGELVTISDFLLRQFRESHGITPAHVIPIGIDAAGFPPEATTRDIDIMGAGALIPLKQYDLLLDVVQRAAAVLPGLKAVHCGGGPETERLAALLRSMKLEAHLELNGELEREVVLRLMRRTRVFLHPSSYEGFGMVCTEALYAGAQVISFSRPMDRAIPNWHIVQTAEEMAAKAMALLQDRHTVYRSVLPFAMEDTVRAILALYGYKPSALSST